ncbi:MAG: histidinol-phosphate transaminase [Bacteroidales bacterium]|nr:histidinol-phosphate transaminase [Bacteroidales bacterium]
MIFGHGDDSYLYGNNIKANFSSNCFFEIDNKGLINHLKANIESLISSYPHPQGKEMMETLGEFHSIETNRISIFNGATEAIYTVANLFKDKSSLILCPTFSEYESACKIFNHTIDKSNLVSFIKESGYAFDNYALNSYKSNSKDGEKSEYAYNDEKKYINSNCKIIDEIDVVWLCNPNNPTGTVFPIELLKKIIYCNSDKFFIIDQSYWMFTTKEVLDVKNSFTNVIIINSLTKEFCIPGLRLGYITSCKELIEKIDNLKMPWTVNAIAIEAGKYLLNHNIEIKEKLINLINERNRVIKEISKIDGFECFDSDTHFFLCKSEKIKVEELKNILANKYGILIRNAENFGENCKSMFRIAVLDEEKNSMLIEAINEIAATFK